LALGDTRLSYRTRGGGGGLWKDGGMVYEGGAGVGYPTGMEAPVVGGGTLKLEDKSRINYLYILVLTRVVSIENQ